MLTLFFHSNEPSWNVPSPTPPLPSLTPSSPSLLFHAQSRTEEIIIIKLNPKMKLVSILTKKSSQLFTKSSKNKQKKKQLKLSKDDPSSFGSSTTTASSSSSLLETPRSVLLPPVTSVADVFNVFDRDRDGKITRVELEAVLRRLGPEPLTEAEVGEMVMEADRDGDGCISLEEMELIDLFGGDVGELDEMRGVFRVFDVDGDGKISAEELRGVLEVLGEDCGVEECGRMIQGVDSDGDGFVGFDDFVRMMMMGGGR